jgi:hypothetical protein
MDREKVINDLQDAVNDDWMWQHADYYAKAMENAIALLKEQESVTYKVVKAGEKSYPFYDLVCTGCGNKTGMRMDWKYCPGCGRVVKWNDWQGEGY